jgi:hypothetical protein
MQIQRYATDVTITISAPETTESRSNSSQNPFTTSLDELVKHQTHIIQCKATNVESKELGCISSAQFKSYVRFG